MSFSLLFFSLLNPKTIFTVQQISNSSNSNFSIPFQFLHLAMERIKKKLTFNELFANNELAYYYYILFVLYSLNFRYEINEKVSQADFVRTDALRPKLSISLFKTYSGLFQTDSRKN
jgi:Trk-type K+ transport system membrane component